MKEHWTKVCAVLLLTALAQPAAAQGAAWAAPAGCTYQTCALRVEPVFLGVALVKGTAGDRVARLGGFGDGANLLLRGPDSAAAYARSYVSASKSASTLGLLAAAAYGVVLARTGNFGSADGTDVVIGLGGAGLLIASVPLTLKAQRSLARSVWWYNAALQR